MGVLEQLQKAVLHLGVSSLVGLAVENAAPYLGSLPVHVSRYRMRSCTRLH